MSAIAANPFAQLVRVAMQPMPVVDNRQPASARPGELKYQMLIRLIRELGPISTGALVQAAGLDTRRVWGLLKTPLKLGRVQHTDGNWLTLPVGLVMSTELLEWHPVADLPDSDITVVAWKDEDGYFGAYWDDGEGAWIDCATGGQVQGITHWAQPKGPR